MVGDGRRGHDRYGFDQELRRRHAVTFLAGVDEVGRGPLAGPVVAAAVILPPDVDVPGADDSKRLSPADRVLVALEVRRVALAIGFGSVSPAVIDRINILEATRLAMRRALAALSPVPQLIVVDGWPLPDTPFRQEAFPKADSLSLAVACLVLGGAQVLVSSWGNPILGGLTIVVLAAVVLRLRPQGFARG